MKKAEQQPAQSVVKIPIPERLQFCRISSGPDGVFTVELDIPETEITVLRALASALQDGAEAEIAGVQTTVCECIPAALGAHRRVRLSVRTISVEWPALVDELECRSVCVDFAGVGL